MVTRGKAYLRIFLWGAILALVWVPEVMPAPDDQDSDLVTNPTRRLVTPRKGQSAEQQHADEWECFERVCDESGWNPYEAHARLVDEGYTVALRRDELIEGLINLAYDGAVTGSVAGDMLGGARRGAEIGAAIAVASGLIRSGYLDGIDSPEAQRAISGFERNLRYWNRKYAACLRPKGYRVPSTRY